MTYFSRPRTNTRSTPLSHTKPQPKPKSRRAPRADRHAHMAIVFLNVRPMGTRDVFHLFEEVEAMLQRDLKQRADSHSRKSSPTRPLYTSPYMSRTGNSRSSRASSSCESSPSDQRIRMPIPAEPVEATPPDHSSLLRLMFTRWIRACACGMQHPNESLPSNSFSDSD
jgi:hypothetical protein